MTAAFHDNSPVLPAQGPFPRSPLLVSLHGLHETVAAGYGSAMAYVRTLDDVSFSLRERDLVLVTGSAAAGSAALVAAVGGRRRIMQGSRALAPGVRVRRACIPPRAARTIVEAWSQCMQQREAQPDVQTGANALEVPVRTAYILRVGGSRRSATDPCVAAGDRGRDSALSESLSESWRSWARVLYGSGGAVMLWTPDARTSREPGAGHAGSAHSQRGDRVHEPGSAAAPPGVARVDVGEVNSERQTGRVRRLTLAAGRIVVEQTMNASFSEAGWRPSSWSDDSGASRSPAGWSRSPTGSTAPSTHGDGAPPAASPARTPFR